MKYFIKTSYLLTLFLVLLAFSCSSKNNLNYKNTKASLRELMHDIKNAQDNQNFEKAKVLIMSIIPSKSSVKKALKPNLDSKFINESSKMSAYIEKRKKGKSKKVFNEFLSKKFFRIKKAQTQVLVHEATTEDLIAYKKDSVAWKEFSGGARKAANKVLKPKMKFYQVEFLEPGKKRGMKYHLFYWDGKNCKMLGKVWRAL